MVQSTSSPVVTLATSAVAEVESDLVILPMFEGESVVNAVPGLSDATGGAIDRALASKEIQGKPYELFLTPVVRGWRAARVALVGAGPAGDFTLERLRRMATAAALAARQRRVASIAFVHRLPVAAADAVQVITEGLTLALFTGDRYKSQDKSGPAPERMLVVVADAGASVAALERAIDRGRVLGESSNLARELCNEPSNILTPTVFAERGAAIARSAGLSVEVLDEEEIERLQMGLLLGVARGSAEPPRVIVMTHEPAGAPAAPVLGLVGKGITFDTGGISIKPADGMERMKDDMAGGAAVIGAMRAIVAAEGADQRDRRRARRPRTCRAAGRSSRATC